jgi:hypothetical protein
VRQPATAAIRAESLNFRAFRGHRKARLRCAIAFNRATAKALGLEISPMLLSTADDLID